MICIADSSKPEAVPAVSALQRMGIKVAMLTGDNVRTAWAIAQQVRTTCLIMHNVLE
jgi:Cu+-exporting ATPase